MYFNKKAWLVSEQLLQIFDLKDDCQLYLSPYKQLLSEIDVIKIGGTVYYDQKAVLAIKEEQNIKDVFLKSIQSCILLLLDIVKDKKSRIAGNLGFKNIGALDSFLEQKIYTKKVAFVYVKLCKNYKWVVDKYDKGDF